MVTNFKVILVASNRKNLATPHAVYKLDTGTGDILLDSLSRDLNGVTAAAKDVFVRHWLRLCGRALYRRVATPRYGRHGYMCVCVCVCVCIHHLPSSPLLPPPRAKLPIHFGMSSSDSGNCNSKLPCGEQWRTDPTFNSRTWVLQFCEHFCKRVVFRLKSFAPAAIPNHHNACHSASAWR
jgi:hypothetical protein